jgi:hypothetical protein
MTLFRSLTNWPRMSYTCSIEDKKRLPCGSIQYINTVLLWNVLDLSYGVRSSVTLLKYGNVTLIQKWHDSRNHECLTIRLWIWSFIHFDGGLFCHNDQFCLKSWHYHHHSGYVEWRFFLYKPFDSSSRNTSASICKIHMETKLISKQNYISLLLSLAQTSGCPFDMRLTMTLSHMYTNKRSLRE